MYLRLGQVRLGAGEPAAGARGLGCDIRLPQGLETWVVTSASAGARNIGFDVVRGGGGYSLFLYGANLYPCM